MHTSDIKHRKWEEAVRSLGCIITGDPVCVIHHPLGRSGKHNKVRIGGWLVLPLREDYHVHTDYSVHGNKKRFIEENGRQCDMFKSVIELHMDKFGTHPVPPEVIDAIMDWGK